MGDTNGVVKQEEELGGVEDGEWLRVIELGSLCCLPMALKAAINLNVFEVLQRAAAAAAAAADDGRGSSAGDGGDENNQCKGLLSASEIVSRIHIFTSANPKAPSSLDRILRVLASHSILTATTAAVSSASASASASSSNGHHTPTTTLYGLTPLCKYFIDDPSLGASLAPIILMNQDKVFIDTWHHLDQAVIDGGEPFTKAHGMDAFTYGQEDLRFDKLFNSAMANHSKLLIKALLVTYDGFEGLHSLVDVGGGFGSCLHMIVSKYPRLKGINFDQPHVIEVAPSYPGVQHVAGDMFISIPQGDAIFMKWILHDWSNEHCIKLLKNCYNALPMHGKVIVVDAVLPMKVDTSLRARVGYQMDLLMFAYNQGGRERTHEELEKLAKAAGFIKTQVICKINESSVVELYKY